MKKKAAKPSKRTSSRVAKIAGKILEAHEDSRETKSAKCLWYVVNYGKEGEAFRSITWGELLALAASCLSQTEPEAKGKK